MTKKEICTENPAIAIYNTGSIYFGLSVHYVNEEEEIVYFSIDFKHSFVPHKSKIYYNRKGEPYFKYDRFKIPFNECIKCNL